MSELYARKQALHLLEQRLAKCALSSDVRIFFVCSYPRSDMGKGTLVAHMLRILPDSNAIKFDGLLNTNANGRHTAVGHDDFGIYEKYNPGKKFTDEHYILGGYLYKDFIDRYGEYENLTFRPYMAKHFLATIQEMWANIGKPKNLIVELGGTITDFEVDPYVSPVIREMKELYGAHCKLLLLTETSYNNEYIKTKTVQDSVDVFLKRGLTPDIIVAREPGDLHGATMEQHIEHERTIRTKLQETFGLAFPKIISVPFYTQDKIDKYGLFLDQHFAPFILPSSNQRRILIGSNNPNKIADWKSYVNGEFEIVSPDDLGLKLEVVEGMTSVKENSLAKAKAWSRLSGLPAIADDTGFCIDALGGLPGVAVRRWGGQLPDTASNVEFFEYMRLQVQHLEDTSCHFEAVVTLALPNGEDYQIVHETHGYIDKELLTEGYKEGSFPLGLVFKKADRNKVWADMTDEEKRESDKELVDKVMPLLRSKLVVASKKQKPAARKVRR
ncbi:MAG TPA: non-canonical purine NTP pyrophosphatase [Candidatus Saccharimonadales bacterium]|nr:non-canonical purine NTP pyrophosphatase [Candidatus Saccharimonadales bacterium]